MLIKGRFIVVAVFAALVLMCGLTATAAYGLGEATCGSVADADNDCLDSAFESQPVTRFAPQVRLHPNDKYRPSGVEWQISGTALAHGSCGTLLAQGLVTVTNITGSTCNGQSSGLSLGKTGFFVSYELWSALS